MLSLPLLQPTRNRFAEGDAFIPDLWSYNAGKNLSTWDTFTGGERQGIVASSQDF